MLPGQQTTQTQQTTPQTQYPWYQQLGRSLFQGETEKSLVDKLLGRGDADKLHKLMQKEPLTKSDIEEILFLMTSIDQKIVNYNEWDRYVIVKLFPWVKDYSTICKTWMIYEEQFLRGDFDNDFTQEEEIEIEVQTKEELEKYKNNPALKEIANHLSDGETKKIKVKVKPILEETKQIVSETTKYLQHNLKFLISMFLLVSNSTLSIDGAAFETLSTARYDYQYTYPGLGPQQPQQRTSGSALNKLFGPRK